MNSDHYVELTRRHAGIFSSEQQARLRGATVAVGGLGMGGSVLIDLVRMGVGGFRIADLDHYEASNCNRQRLAKTSTLGRTKVECMRDEARDILPEVRLVEYPHGITLDNVGSFVDGVDHVIDVVDVYAYREKIALHRAARERKIPCTVCFSIGYGGVATTFPYDLGSAGYEEITGTSIAVDSHENTRRLIVWLGAVVPAPIREGIEGALRGEGSIPFVVTGVEIGAAIAAAATVEHLLHGSGVYAPEVIAFDPFRLPRAHSSVVRL